MFFVKHRVVAQFAIIAVYLQKFINRRGKTALGKCNVSVAFLFHTVIAQLNYLINTQLIEYFIKAYIQFFCVHFLVFAVYLHFPETVAYRIDIVKVEFEYAHVKTCVFTARIYVNIIVYMNRKYK
jgi:hypothetical protein